MLNALRSLSSFEIAFGELPNGSIAAKSNQIGYLLKHEPKLVKGYVGQLAEAHVEDLLGMGEQLFVACNVVWIDALDLFKRVFYRAAVV